VDYLIGVADHHAIGVVDYEHDPPLVLGMLDSGHVEFGNQRTLFQSPIYLRFA
jgi:hypothetical protein